MNDANAEKRTSAAWDGAATLGLVTLLVLIVGIVAAVVTLTHPAQTAPKEGIPDTAVDVSLPAEKLARMEELFTPLLRGGVPAFDSEETFPDGEAVAALIFHQAVNDPACRRTDDGSVLVPAAPVGAMFAELTGRILVPDSVRLPQVVVYDAEADAYRIAAAADFLAYYRSDAAVRLVSTHTLDDTVFVRAQLFTLTSPEPAEGESDEDVPAEPAEEVETVLRSAVFTLRVTADGSVLTALRDV